MIMCMGRMFEVEYRFYGFIYYFDKVALVMAENICTA